MPAIDSKYFGPIITEKTLSYYIVFLKHKEGSNWGDGGGTLLYIIPILPPDL